MCYGDALGLNFSQQYYPQKRSIIPKRSYSTYLLSLINLFDQKLFNYTKIESEILLSVIEESSKIFDFELSTYFNNINNFLSQSKKIIFLLSANYSETGRIKLVDEIKCYEISLCKYASKNDSLIIVKPHPRDSAKKHIILEDSLKQIASNVIFLSDNFKHIPFEIIYYLLLKKYNLDTLNHRILSSSSSILFIEYLFKKECDFMFGIDIVMKYFTEDWIQLRIQHEKDIINAIGLIRSNKII